MTAHLCPICDHPMDAEEIFIIRPSMIIGYWLHENSEVIM